MEVIITTIISITTICILVSLASLVYTLEKVKEMDERVKGWTYGEKPKEED